MLRTLTRWFSTSETKQLAEDVDKMVDRFQDMGLKLESLQLRIERQLNKLQMREARGERARGGGMTLSEEEEDILRDIRRKSGNGHDGGSWGEPPRFE